MSASKCEENVDFVSFAADLSLLITSSVLVTVSSVVGDVLVEVDVWLRRCWVFFRRRR